MGLDKSGADMLRAAKALGADFTKSVMIGRQEVSRDGDTINYAEPFFTELGAKEIDSVDASDFEGASIIHDMNNPLPDELRGRFTLLFDGGTTEHIFNAPQALRNYMEMLAPGGFLVSVTPGNNHMGHGFWQASPELLYRVFSPANGFETLGVFVCELRRWWRDWHYGPYYLAHDPAELGWRVELNNHWPVYLAVISRKVADVEPFAKWPQQSDYSARWVGKSKPVPSHASIKAMIRRLIPEGGERMLRGTFANKAYTLVSRNDLVAGRLPRLR